jgi:hypothetical protein
LYELGTPCRGGKEECEYYIPDLLHNLDADVMDPITFAAVLISAEALHFYQVSNTTIIAYCCHTEREYPWDVAKALARWILIHSITPKQRRVLLPLLAAAVKPVSNNTRHDLRTSTNASGKPLNSPRRLCLRS